MDKASSRPSLLILAGLLILLLWSALDYGGRYLHVQAIAQALTGGLLIMAVLSRPGSWRTIRQYPLFQPTAFLLGCLSLAWLFSVNRLASLEELLRYLMYLALPVLVAHGVRSQQQYRLASFTVAGVGLLVCLVGWLQSAQQQALGSTFYRTNDLAAYLLLIIPFAFHATLVSPDRREKAYFGLCTAVTLVSLAATNSRSGWIVCLLSLAILAWLHRQHWRHRNFQLASLVVLVLAGLLLIPFAPAILPRLQALPSIMQENATQWRLSLLKGAWHIFLAHPLTGSGPNTFAAVLPQFQEKPGYFSINPHNYYLQTLAESGLIGFIALLAFIGLLLRHLLRHLRAHPFNGGILAALIASLVHTGLEIDWSVTAIPILFFFLAGLALSSLPATPTPQRVTWLEKGALVFTGTMVMMLPAMNYFSAKAYSEGVILLNQGKAQQAIGFIRQAIWLAPWPSARHYNALGSYYLSQKEYGKGLEAARKALSLDAYNSEHYHLASRALQFQGEHEQALGLLQKAVEYNPYKHPDLYGRIGDYYWVERSDKELALKWYHQATTAFAPREIDRYEAYEPGDRYELFNIYKKIAQIHEQRDEPQRAAAYSEKADNLLSQARPDTVAQGELKTPLQAITQYWRDHQQAYRQGSLPTQLVSDSLLAGSAIPYLPGEVNFSRLTIMGAQREIDTAHLVYALPWRPKGVTGWKRTIVSDWLVLTAQGWRIYQRNL